MNWKREYSEAYPKPSQTWLGSEYASDIFVPTRIFLFTVHKLKFTADKILCLRAITVDKYSQCLGVSPRYEFSHNILRQIKKSSKMRQERKTLISVFFISAVLKIYFCKRNWTMEIFLLFPFFPKILSLKSFGSS